MPDAVTYQRGTPGLSPLPSDDLPCDRCPILNLGVQYPVGDPRDPWRRMPKLFLKAQALFGRSMFSHTGKSRITLETRMGHYCRVMRERHGPCNTPRMRLCATAIGGVLDWARHDTEQMDKRRAKAFGGITALVNDDNHHEQMKTTRHLPTYAGIRVPPISLDDALEDAPDA